VQKGGYIRFSLPRMPHSLIAGIEPFPSLTDFDWSEMQLILLLPVGFIYGKHFLYYEKIILWVWEV
jgi:hypothetical protein